MIFQAYHRNDLARLRFSQYKMKQEAVATLGNLIIGTRPDGSENNALIAIGATHFSGSSPIKGHGRVPHKALSAYLKERATNEWCIRRPKYRDILILWQIKFRLFRQVSIIHSSI